MSLIKTHPKLKYQLYHGIKFKNDVIKNLSETNYYKFVSRENVNLPNYFNGRITDNLDKIIKYNKDSFVFLCGNSLMVTEIYDTLIECGFRPENIFTEIFF